MYGKQLLEIFLEVQLGRIYNYFIYPDLSLLNLNIIPFNVPLEDEFFLKNRVLEFIKLLNKNENT